MNLILLNLIIITLLLIFEPIIAGGLSSSTTKTTSTAPFVKNSTTKISHNISSLKPTTFHSTLLTKLSTKKLFISTKKIATTQESVKTIKPTDKSQAKKISYMPLIIVGSISAVIVSCVTFYVLYVQYFKEGNSLIGGPVTENGLQLNSISNDNLDIEPSTSYSNRGIAAFHEVSNEYIQKEKS